MVHCKALSGPFLMTLKLPDPKFRIFDPTAILQHISPVQQMRSCITIVACFKVKTLLFKIFLTPSIQTLYGLTLPRIPYTPNSITLFAIISFVHIFYMSKPPFNSSCKFNCHSYSFLNLCLTVTPHILFITISLNFSQKVKPPVSAPCNTVHTIHNHLIAPATLVPRSYIFLYSYLQTFPDT